MATGRRSVTLPFRVSLDFNLHHNVVVAVSGNIEQLGSWDPHKCVALERIEKKLEGEVWGKDIVIIPTSETISFRYLTAEIIDFNDEGDSRLVKIMQWETHFSPRTLKLTDILLKDEVETHTFGTIDGTTKLQRGWLTGQHEIHLRIYGEAFKWFKPRHRDRRLYLRCARVTLRQEQIGEGIRTEDSNMSIHGPGMDDDETRDSFSHPHLTQYATFSALRPGVVGSHRPGFLSNDGVAEFRAGDYLTFHTQATDLEAMTIEFEVFVGAKKNMTEADPQLVGSIRMMPFEHLAGVKWLHIFGNHRRVIGQMKVDFLIINSLSQTPQTLERSFSKHWTDRGVLKVGHRGAGSSYGGHDGAGTKKSAVKENTLRSLRTAFEHGADYVEFDVHLSKDKVPVIYHDFKVVLTLKKKRRRDHSYMEIAVKDLTLAELQALKVSHSEVLTAGHTNDEMTMEESDCLDTLAFLTLRQVFEHFDGEDPDSGFNIEVKYPIILQNGESEQDNYFERNESMDIIIKEVFRSAGERRIVFSSFDPDVCTMLRLKQNKYPVLFLSQGVTTKYMPYVDPRTQSLTMSIYHAVDIDILGVCVFYDEFLSNSAIMPLIKENNLVVFVWGSDIEDADEQRRLRELNVNAIIFDRIHEVHESCSASIFQGRLESLPDSELSETPDGVSTTSTNSAVTNPDYSNCDNSNNSNRCSVDSEAVEPNMKRQRIS